MIRPDPYEGLPELYQAYPWLLPDIVAEFIDRHGHEHPGRPVPPAWRHHKAQARHDCYGTAGQPGHGYTEGIALQGDWGWIPHAWITVDNQVIDLAWNEPGSLYRGVVIPEPIAARARLKRDSWGPLLPAIIETGWTP